MLVAAHIRLIKRYCSGRVEDIEGWAEAVSSPEPYECHHRMEIQPDGTLLSKQWMIDHGIYFNVDPWALVMLPKSEHRKLHNRNRRETGRIRKPLRAQSKYVQHTGMTRRELGAYLGMNGGLYLTQAVIDKCKSAGIWRD